jgi:Putative transposase/Transposase zinc-binding domain
MRPPLELADVFRSLDTGTLEREGMALSSAQRRVLRDIVRCRSAALGGHLEQCDQCGHRRIAYNSCRNRHCPKCQAAARAEWLEERAAELLPVEYYHVVFTLPEQLSLLALQNKRVIYGLLFKAASETLLTIAGDPQHLGAEIGFLAVLHTWGQTLQHHPHLHCVVPGGGLSPDQTKWIGCRKGFFLPVKVLSRLFRGKFISLLSRAFAQGELICAGQLAQLAQRPHFEELLDELSRREWVVYAKPPFGGPEQVLKYLARYTHRVAISNQRLLGLADDQVTFSYKDYAAGNVTKTMTLRAGEFTRRFLLHVLPKGFVRIRHYGWLANRGRQEKLSLCRRLIEQSCPGASLSSRTMESAQDKTALPESELCPECRQGKMIRREILRPVAGTITEMQLAPLADSS